MTDSEAGTTDVRDAVESSDPVPHETSKRGRVPHERQAQIDRVIAEMDTSAVVYLGMFRELLWR
jgi:hypothetical protein